MRLTTGQRYGVALLLAFLNLTVFGQSPHSLSGGHLVGKTAPDFTVVDLQGNRWRLSQWKGKTVILAFFAFWCDTWEDVAKTLRILKGSVPASSVQFICIAIDPSWKEVGMRRQAQFPCPVGVDRGGAIRRLYGIKQVPTLLLVDAEGTVRLGCVGVPSVQTLKRTLTQLGNLSQRGTKNKSNPYRPNTLRTKK